MRKFLDVVLNRHFFLFVIVATSFFSVCSFHDAYLYSSSRKHKEERRKRRAERDQIKVRFEQDLMDIVCIMRKSLVLCNELQLRVKHIESRLNISDDEIMQLHMQGQ